MNTPAFGLFVAAPLACIILSFRAGAFASAALLVLISAWFYPPVPGVGWAPVSPLPGQISLAAGLALIALARYVLTGPHQRPYRALILDDLVFIYANLPVLSELAQGRGLSSGLHLVPAHAAPVVLPYLVGRSFLTGPSRASVSPLTVALALSVLVALAAGPLVLAETFSPTPLLAPFLGQTSETLPSRHPLLLNIWGPAGFRPTLTMGPLALGLHYSAATVAALALLLTTTSGRARLGWALAMVTCAVLCLACRVTAASALLVLGILALLASSVRPTRWLCLFPLLIPLIYLPVRWTGAWDPTSIADVHREDAPAAALNKNWSLWSRFNQEARTMDAVAQSPLLGLGKTADRRWQNTGIPGAEWLDSDWVYHLARHGWLGLSVWLLLMTALPVVAARLALRPAPLPTALAPTAVAPDAYSAPPLLAAAVTIITSLFFIDALLNDTSPILPMLLTGITASTLASRSIRPTVP